MLSFKGKKTEAEILSTPPLPTKFHSSKVSRLDLKAELDRLVHPVVTALRRLRQGDHRLQASLGYILSPCLNTKNTELDTDSLALGAVLHVVALE